MAMIKKGFDLFNMFKGKALKQLVNKVGLVGCLCFAELFMSYSYAQQISVQKQESAPKVQPKRMTLKPVKLNENELKNLSNLLSPVERPASSISPPGVIPIEVTMPEAEEIWEAGKQYFIKWRSGNGDVRIDLVSRLSRGGKPLSEYSIVKQAPNSGTYIFTVPYKWTIEPFAHYVRVKTLDGLRLGYSAGPRAVYTQPVDLQCLIVDTSQWVSAKSNGSSISTVSITVKAWLEFNVLIRNKGVNSPVTIQEILVRLIKEPENIVVFQEEWSSDGIYNHDWYKLLSEPRKIDISKLKLSLENGVEKDINLSSGSYLLEVELDPHNRLGEEERYRDDNKCRKIWLIK